MGYGDAFVYCLIITEKQAKDIKETLVQIDAIQKIIDEILEDHKKNPESNPERGAYGLALMDEQGMLYWRIQNIAKNPVAMYHVATDDWLPAWEICSKFNYKVVTVARFLEGTHGKLWGGESIGKNHGGKALCMCLPSHYDTDDEFLEGIVGTMKLKDYNAQRGFDGW